MDQWINNGARAGRGGEVSRGVNLRLGEKEGWENSMACPALRAIRGEKGGGARFAEWGSGRKQQELSVSVEVVRQSEVMMEWWSSRKRWLLL